MGKRKNEHLIGEPVVAPIERGLIRSFGHKSYIKRYLKRTLIVSIVAVICSEADPLNAFGSVDEPQICDKTA